ncbi:MAG TPA: tetraacyldisaccharide 4'-kinase, partial [Burkholderiales bacterium]|nr:tetraacyldisaccharide 4'-kinase [Burkholderiales bacterium]
MRHWYSRGAIAWLLWPVSLLFGWIVFFRRLFYKLRFFKSHDAGVPVIVVGNLTAGGSGKTPIAIAIAARLKERGRNVCFLTRGYGGSAAAPTAATIASDPAEVGDEPMLLARRSGCPVWVAPDRVAACRALRAQHPECDVIVADDGLQHYALRRDVEVCVV